MRSTGGRRGSGDGETSKRVVAKPRRRKHGSKKRPLLQQKSRNSASVTLETTKRIGNDKCGNQHKTTGFAQDNKRVWTSNWTEPKRVRVPSTLTLVPRPRSYPKSVYARSSSRYLGCRWRSQGYYYTSTANINQSLPGSALGGKLNLR